METIENMVNFLEKRFRNDPGTCEWFSVPRALGRLQKLLELTSGDYGEDEAQELLDWSRMHSLVKVKEAAVPTQICPPQISSMELSDIKVGGKARKPDDAYYDKSEVLRERVPRGLCILQYKIGGEPGWKARIVVHAFHKFTGGLEDNDDCNTDPANFSYGKDYEVYFRQRAESAETIVCTQKINGEAAHFSAIEINGSILYCAGSKNVHMLFRNEADIELHRDSRYMWARSIAKTVLRDFNRMEEETRQMFISFLVMSKLTGVFEILSKDHEHVESLDHLSEPQMWFLGWSQGPPFDRETSNRSLLSLPPVDGYKIAEAFGLRPTPYSVIPLTSLQERIDYIHRNLYGVEGEVLMFVNEAQEVIGLVKKKSIWYICLRAIREKVKSAITSQMKSMNAKESPSTKVSKHTPSRRECKIKASVGPAWLLDFVMKPPSKFERTRYNGFRTRSNAASDLDCAPCTEEVNTRRKHSTKLTTMRGAFQSIS
ncbi:unnamed protein product [Cyprideis torosa]|uniref:DUF7920 domain-containing protein n=1 Tax=Cyprideis torosa TaxID=163714 RepID=A0A7R8ZSL3_9CRUS|nr:unnamed protein product [Cyprideis torosa]CAG0896340.1 unnamed protein product [Cyprideis torosa]